MMHHKASHFLGNSANKGGVGVAIGSELAYFEGLLSTVARSMAGEQEAADDALRDAIVGFRPTRAAQILVSFVQKGQYARLKKELQAHLPEATDPHTLTLEVACVLHRRKRLDDLVQVVSRVEFQGGSGATSSQQSEETMPDVPHKVSMNICQSVVSVLSKMATQPTAIHQSILLSALPHLPSSLYGPLLQAFRVKTTDENRQQLVGLANSLIERRAAKEVARVVGLMGLQREVPIEQVLGPMLVASRLQNARAYVGSDADLRQGLLRLLDSECKKALDGPLDIQGAQARPLAKAALKLMEDWHCVDRTSYPHVFQLADSASIRFLYRSRARATGNRDNWDELLVAYCLQAPYLQPHLVQLLAADNDFAGIEFFRQAIPTLPSAPTIADSISAAGLIPAAPNSVLGYARDQDDEQDDEPTPPVVDEEGPLADETEQIGEGEDVLSLSVEVVVVQTVEGLAECQADIIGQDIVGVDFEWRPAMLVQMPVRCSIMQVALRHRVYLLDLVALPPAPLQAFLDYLAKEDDILKIGYGVRGDAASMSDTPGFTKETLDGMVDLHELQVRLYKLSKKPLHNVVGLSSLCKLWLGRPLDKTNQMSDWERRPLRPAQVTYAALDAHCLLGVYDRLSAELSQYGDADPEDMGQKESKSKKKMSKAQKAQLLHQQERGLLADELEKQRQQLGRRLRSCGVDTHLHTAEDNGASILAVAKAEQRIVLTRGRSFLRLQRLAKLSEESDGVGLYCVEHNDTDGQLVEVLQHFGIKINPSDIFSRCHLCNGSGYDILTVEQLRAELHRARLDDSPAATMVSAVPEGVLDKVQEFFRCQHCSKVYWDGKHFNNIMEHFGKVLQATSNAGLPPATD